jgi:hypothetical protein
MCMRWVSRHSAQNSFSMAPLWCPPTHLRDSLLQIAASLAAVWLSTLASPHIHTHTHTRTRTHAQLDESCLRLGTNVLCVLTPCNLVHGSQRFRQICCILLQVSQIMVIWFITTVSQDRATAIFGLCSVMYLIVVLKLFSFSYPQT